MAQRKKTSRRSSRNAEAGTFKADESSVRGEDAVKDMAAEERGDFMKRRAAEESDIKDRAQVTDYHYELRGHKVLKLVRKKNGALYSFYVGNVKKTPGILQDPDIKAHLKK